MKKARFCNGNCMAAMPKCERACSNARAKTASDKGGSVKKLFIVLLVAFLFVAKVFAGGIGRSRYNLCEVTAGAAGYVAHVDGDEDSFGATVSVKEVLVSLPGYDASQLVGRITPDATVMHICKALYGAITDAKISAVITETRDGRIDINIATYRDIRGIGFSVLQARNIIRYIVRHGPLSSTNELKRIALVNSYVVDTLKNKIKTGALQEAGTSKNAP